MRLPTYSVAVKGGRMPDHTAEPRELYGFRTGGGCACGGGKFEFSLGKAIGRGAREIGENPV